MVFHIDNQVIVDAIETDCNHSQHTMSQLCLLLMLTACIHFTFSAEWLPSKANVLADAASHFQYSLLFQLMLHLHPKPCSQSPQLSGMKLMLISHDKVCGISGMASHPAPASPTAQGNTLFSTSCASIQHTARPIADSSQLLREESWSGPPHSKCVVSSPRPSKHTCPACTHFTSMLTFRSDTSTPVK